MTQIEIIDDYVSPLNHECLGNVQKNESPYTILKKSSKKF